MSLVRMHGRFTVRAMGSLCCEAVAASEEIIQPFLLACDSKNLKVLHVHAATMHAPSGALPLSGSADPPQLVAVAISSVQKLISRNAVAEVRIVRGSEVGRRGQWRCNQIKERVRDARDA